MSKGDDSLEMTYKALATWIKWRGYSPSYRELAYVRGASKTTIARHLRILCEQGRVTRSGNAQRTWRPAE